MIHNKNGIKIRYDREADVLYVTRGKPEHTDYVEYSDDVILRFDPRNQTVGRIYNHRLFAALLQTRGGHYASFRRRFPDA